MKSKAIFKFNRLLLTFILTASAVFTPAIAGIMKNITLVVDTQRIDLRADGYELIAKSDSVVITGKAIEGVLNGIQTFRQLFPPEIEKRQIATGVNWNVPEVTIVDTSLMLWRGVHLDCCRHFFTIPAVKRFIDQIAFLKFNRFHWHLTEDQGWRIEIKKYPKLQEVAAWRTENGQKYGGYYTQEEVKEIVAYAKQRGITTIPEIEMPGHSLAALAAYPQLSCTGGPFQVATGWGVFPDIYCAGNDSVFTFLQNVLTEVAGLFPAPYIHIGGDEAVKDRWNACPKCQARIKAEHLANSEELQSWFIKRIQAFLKTRQRDIIGWDEITQGGLANGAVVQWWWYGRPEVVNTAISQGSYTITSPCDKVYLMDGYDKIPHKTVYDFDAVPSIVSASNARFVLGSEACFWSEGIPNPSILEEKMYPRLCAFSEVMWSPRSLRNWDSYLTSLGRYAVRLSNAGINYYKDPLIPANPPSTTTTIMPRPAQMTLNSSKVLTLASTTVINVTDKTKSAGEILAAQMAPSTGFQLNLSTTTNTIARMRPASGNQGSLSFRHSGSTLTIYNTAGKPLENIRVLDICGRVIAQYRGCGESLCIRHIAPGSYLVATDRSGVEKGINPSSTKVLRK